MDLHRKVRLACAEGMSAREAARHFGVSRDSVRKMPSFSAPPGYRRRAVIKRPKLDGFGEIIDAWLAEDQGRNRKQRHTAKRVFERLRDEHGFTGVWPTVGTSTGKTTFVRSRFAMVDLGERILTIEDAHAIFPHQDDAVALKAECTAHAGRTPAHLLEASLRIRPDRIILGELRNEESRTFLKTIDTGYGETFTTIHADIARTALDRLAIAVLAAGLSIGYEDVKRCFEGVWIS